MSGISTSQRRLLFILLAVVALIVSGTIYKRYQEQSDVETVRDWVGAASMPSDMSGVLVDRTDAFTWTGFHLRFHAPPEQIEQWIKVTPVLSRQKPKRFDRQHQLLPAKLNVHDRNPWESKHEYFVNRNHPAWFDFTLRQSGRRYTIDEQGKMGMVIVNDTEHTVFIRVYDN